MNKPKQLSRLCFCSLLFQQPDAATYLVGKGKDFATLQDVVGRLKPVDIVLVDGDASASPGYILIEAGLKKTGSLSVE